MRTLRTENIAPLVHLVRGEKVLFDADLAALYGVTTKALNQAVKRNRERFPADFVFRLTDREWTAIRSQTVTTSSTTAMRSQIGRFVPLMLRPSEKGRQARLSRAGAGFHTHADGRGEQEKKCVVLAPNLRPTTSASTSVGGT
ncbi:MAG: ORF6N domain-containing protein [Betaproteobacteria bacterium]|nr:MAG: ORF6N domain-containing protein [Betaproteobacteria bacterium]